MSATSQSLFFFVLSFSFFEENIIVFLGCLVILFLLQRYDKRETQNNYMLIRVRYLNNALENYSIESLACLRTFKSGCSFIFISDPV